MSSTTVTATSATPPQQGRVLASAVSYYNQAAACSQAVLAEALGAHKEFEATARETIEKLGKQLAEKDAVIDRLSAENVTLKSEGEARERAHLQETGRLQASLDAANATLTKARTKIAALKQTVIAVASDVARTTIELFKTMHGDDRSAYPLMGEKLIQSVWQANSPYPAQLAVASRIVSETQQKTLEVLQGEE